MGRKECENGGKECENACPNELVQAGVNEKSPESEDRRKGKINE